MIGQLVVGHHIIYGFQILLSAYTIRLPCGFGYDGFRKELFGNKNGFENEEDEGQQYTGHYCNTVCAGVNSWVQNTTHGEGCYLKGIGE